MANSSSRDIKKSISSMELNTHYFDFENVRVLRVVSPELYWVTCSNCIPPNEVDQHMRIASNKTNCELVYLPSVPKPDERVIVKGTDGILLRGIIKSVEGSTCNVWLVDVCKETRANYSELFINQLLLWRDLDSQAHLIGVCGLPKCSEPENHLTKTSVVDQINKEVELILQQFSGFNFSFENSTKTNGILYGSITLTNRELRLDWSKTLIENGAFKPLNPVVETSVKKSGDTSIVQTQIVKHKKHISSEPDESVIALSQGLITDKEHIVKTSSKVSLIPLNYFYNLLPKSHAPPQIENVPSEEDEDEPRETVFPHFESINDISENNVSYVNQCPNGDLVNSVTAFEKLPTGFPVGRCRPRINIYDEQLTHDTDHGLGRGKYIKHLLTCQLNKNQVLERLKFLNNIANSHELVNETDKVSDAIATKKLESTCSIKTVLEDEINDPTPALHPQKLDFPTPKDNATNSNNESAFTQILEEIPLVLPGVTNHVSCEFLFSESEDETENRTFVGADYIISESLERMKHTYALLHGYPQPKLVSSFNSLALNKSITAKLRALDIVDMAKCQLYSIPVLLDKKNLVLIGPVGTKKTTCYLLPILTHLLDHKFYSQLNPGCGPRAVIIVPNAERVQHVAALCNSFCDGLKIVATHGGGLEIEKKDALANGCDVLISTPRCWLRLLSYKHLTNILRLCHIAFDSYDDLVALFQDELIQIYMTVDNLDKYRLDNKLPYQVQKVFVGKTWNTFLEQIVFHYLKDPVLCITAHLEAAIYAQVKLFLTVLKNEIKEAKLLELIKENKIVRTVIVCNTSDEVDRLKEFLSCYSSNIIIAHENMHHSFIQETRDSWQFSDLLICSDQVLLELGITNAQWLINYSMPLSKSSFSDRFSILQDNFNDRISNPKVGPSKCHAHLLVEDGNELQFPKLIALVERSNAKIPDSLKELSKKIRDNRELLKSSEPFCDKILQFGECRKIEHCPKQHILNVERDNPTVPNHGYVMLKLICVNDASHFSARIVFTADNLNKDISESGWKPYPSKVSQINMIISDHFSNSQNWHLIRKLKVGNLVAFYDEVKGVFLRAQIMMINSAKNIFIAKDVVLWMVDDGGTIRLKSDKLYKLPKAARVIPPQTVSLYLANIQPFDLDIAWSHVATKMVEQKIINADSNDGNLYYIAKILMAIGSSVIIEDFCIYEKLPLLNCYITRLSIRDIMLKLGLGLKSDIHVKKLKELAIDAQMIQTEEEEDSLSEVDSASTDNKWAGLSKDEYSTVFVSNAQSPYLFYVSQVKFKSMLSKLNSDLKKALEKEEVGKLNFIAVGALCAVQNANQEWNRASVITIIGDLEVEVLLVDFGHIIKKNVADIYEIREDLIARLPFQAVECELEGVSPAKGRWCERGNAWFFSSLEADEYPTTFLLKVCDIKLTAEFTGGHHYSVVLINNTDPMTKFCINKEIVNRGYAYWNGQEKSQQKIETILQELPDINIADEIPDEIADEILDEIADEIPGEIADEIVDGRKCYRTSENSELETSQGSEEFKKYDEDGTFNEDGFHFVGFDGEFFRKYLLSAAKANHNNLPSLECAPDTKHSELVSTKTEKSMFDDCDSAYFKQGGLDTVLDSEKVSIIEEGSTTEIAKPIISPTMNLGSNPNEFTSTQADDSQNKNYNTPDISIIKDQHGSYLLNSDEEKTDFEDDYDEIPLLESAISYLTPAVHWRQDTSYIWLKVLIPAISIFQIYSTQEYIVLQAHVNEKLYWLDLDLFGPLKRKTLISKLTGQYLEIKVEKMIRDHMWPRLTLLATGVPNVKHDPEYEFFFDFDKPPMPQDTDGCQEYESASSESFSEIEELGPTPHDPFNPDL